MWDSIHGLHYGPCYRPDIGSMCSLLLTGSSNVPGLHLHRQREPVRQREVARPEPGSGSMLETQEHSRNTQYNRNTCSYTYLRAHILFRPPFKLVKFLRAQTKATLNSSYCGEFPTASCNAGFRVIITCPDESQGTLS